MNTSPAQELQAHLQNLLTSLDQQIQVSNPDLNDISIQIQEFERLFSEKASFLPSYDVKKLQTSILSIKDQYQRLYQAKQPKKKFAFKSRVATQSRREIEVHRAKVPLKEHEGETHVKATLSDKKDETLFLDQGEMDPLLTQLINCTVYMTQTVPSTVHMTDLKNSVIVLGPVQTSVFIERCVDCIFYVYCQQLRMHDSNDCSVYLHVTSKGIIEGCNNIKLAPYLANMKRLNELIDESGLSRTANYWNEIQDFNWLTPDRPSPNWSIIPEKDRKSAPNAD